jgi:hypothetical protein
MPSEEHQLLSRSAAARAAWSILRQLRQCRCGGLTEPRLEQLLSKRHPRSTVRGAMRRLILAGTVEWTGGWAWWRGRKAKVLRASK